MRHGVIAGVFGILIGAPEIASAGKVDLILGLNQGTKTWNVWAKITDDSITFETDLADPGDTILGLALFDVDVVASGSIHITSAAVKAPVGKVGNINVSGFRLNPFATHGSSLARVYAAQDTFSSPGSMPEVVLENVGLASGSDAFGASWGFPVLLASGTYSGTTGKLTVSDHGTGQGPGMTLLYGNAGAGFNNSEKVEFAQSVLGDTVKVGLTLGDINGDGVTDLSDFSILKSNFGLMGGREKGDLDGDAFVTLTDFAILKADFGNTGPVIVPEPHAWLLAVIAVSWAIVIPRPRPPRRD